MAEYVANRNPNRCPTHPGALLAEVVESLGMTKVDVAKALCISRQHLYDLMAEKKPVTADVAVRLGKAFGDGAGVWLRMQAAYDAWHAQRSVDLSKVRSLRAA